MKRIPVFPPKYFHRIRVANANSLDAMITSSGTGAVSAALTLPFKKGHGLIVASWDGVSPAQVKAIGVIVGTDTAGRVEVRWQRVECELPRSDLRGEQFWKQETFKFAETVADSFRLKELFQKHMPDPFAALRDPTP